MDKIFESIEEWMRNLLTGMVSSNLTNMFTDVNEKTGDIASQVGQTPQGWNSSIFSLIQNLSDSVIVPIAGMIKEMNADAVIGVKYGSSQVMSGAAEVIAYGTAVKYKQD